MLFKSTRSSPDIHSDEVTFEECLLNGMAPDGGLYYPKTLPMLSTELMNKWRSMKDDTNIYTTIAFDTITLFSEDSIPHDVLHSILDEAAKSFRLPTWTRIKDLENENVTFRILELFHGPTFSFKDYSIMILGGIINYFLKRRNIIGTALVATSGDTGSAAIAGLSKRSNTRCVVLLPEGKVSEVQQRMMTTVTSDRVKCLLVKGNFDDCQRLLKEAFADREFQASVNLMAVNSVNFGRIICQMVYYFWATIVHQRPDHPSVSVCVPTGNFGNILAAWYARRMGAPIEKLIVASNRNDILPRFYKNGEYKLIPVVPTITPSIDIALSSNFERLIQYYNGTSTLPLYTELQHTGKYTVNTECHKAFASEFYAMSVSEDETLKTISKCWSEHKYLIDPHTAVAVAVSESFAHLTGSRHILTVSTAHPAKFPEAVEAAVGPSISETPVEIRKLFEEQEVYTIIPAKLENVISIIKKMTASN